MKIKLLYINLISVVILVSLTQVVMSIIQLVNIPPYAEHIRSMYKSGYFAEIEKNFQIIQDSFLEIKANAGPQHAWIFLSEMQRKHGISIKVYDSNGSWVTKPGIKNRTIDNRIAEIINSINPAISSTTFPGKYITTIPLVNEQRCSFCHKKNYSTILGIMEFSRPYNAFIYFSAEKLLIFGALFVIMSIVLYFTIKWDPGKNIKELFDKK